MKKLVVMAAAMLPLGSFALGMVPDQFNATTGDELLCVNGPSILELKIGGLTGRGSFLGYKYEVSGKGFTNLYGEDVVDFKAILDISEITTRAIWGHKIEGDIAELNGHLSIKHEVWYSYTGLNIPTVFTGSFVKNETNKEIKLICYPQ